MAAGNGDEDRENPNASGLPKYTRAMVRLWDIHIYVVWLPLAIAIVVAWCLGADSDVVFLLTAVLAVGLFLSQFIAIAVHAR